MSDCRKSMPAAPDPPELQPIGPPPEWLDPEGDHPLRAAFAHYLDPADAAEFTAKLQARYSAVLLERGTRVTAGSSYTRERLIASALDLRLTAAVLASVGQEDDEDVLDYRDSLLSILARPRALEVAACVERVERWSPGARSRCRPRWRNPRSCRG